QGQEGGEGPHRVAEDGHARGRGQRGQGGGGRGPHAEDVGGQGQRLAQAAPDHVVQRHGHRARQRERVSDERGRPRLPVAGGDQARSGQGQAHGGQDGRGRALGQEPPREAEREQRRRVDEQDGGGDGRVRQARDPRREVQ